MTFNNLIKKVKNCVSIAIAGLTIKWLIGLLLVPLGALFVIFKEKIINLLVCYGMCEEVILYITLAFIILILTVVYIIRAYIRIPVPHSNFKILSIDACFCVGDGDKIKSSYVRKYKLKAKNKVKTFTGKFTWEGKYKEKLLRSGHTLSMDKNPNKRYDKFVVTFDHNYRRGEEIMIEIEWELEKGTGLPYNYFRIMEPAKKLTLEVVFLRGSNIEKVKFEESYTVGMGEPLTFEDLDVNNNIVTKEIPKPRTLCAYELRWDNPNQT